MFLGLILKVFIEKKKSVVKLVFREGLEIVWVLLYSLLGFYYEKFFFKGKFYFLNIRKGYITLSKIEGFM